MAKGSSGFDKGGNGKVNKESSQSKPSYFKETEKAVQLKLTVEDHTLDREISRIVWIPKSQLTEDGKPSNWITEQKANEFYQKGWGSNYSAIWQDSNGKKFGAGMTQKEKEYAQERTNRFAAGQKSYNELIAKAKDMGIKGIRVGMKRKTIEKKIREHQK